MPLPDGAVDARATPSRGFQMNWALVGAVAATIWSCNTTGHGIYQVVGQQILGAIFLTAVVQLALAAVSWMLGKEIAHWAVGGPQDDGFDSGIGSTVTRLTIYILVFLLTFSISAFFSFSYYFNTLYSNKQEAIDLAQMPETMEGSFLQPLRDKVDKTYKDGGDVLKGSEAGKAWLDTLDHIVAAARASQPVIEKSIQQMSDKRAAERNAAIGNEPAAKAAFETATQKVAAQKAIIESKKAARDRAKHDSDTAAQEAQDQLDGKDGRTPGPGRQYNIAKQKAVAAQKIADSIKDDFDKEAPISTKLLTELDKAKKKLDDIEKILKDPGVDPASSLGSASFVENAIDALTKARSAFAGDPNVNNYAATVQACRVLLDPLQAQAGSTVGGLSCASNEVDGLVKGRGELNPARTAFNNTCSPASVRTERQSAEQSLAEATPTDRQKGVFKRVSDRVDACMTLAAQTGADTTALRDRFINFQKTSSPDLDQFTRTMAALNFVDHSSSRPQAILAAMISIVQDVFILVLSLFAELMKQAARRGRPRVPVHPSLARLFEREQDSLPVKSAKTILRLGVPLSGARPDFLVSPDDPSWSSVDERVRRQATDLLRMLTRQQGARLQAKGGFEVLPAGASALEQIIDEQGRASEPPPPSNSEVAAALPEAPPPRPIERPEPAPAAGARPADAPSPPGSRSRARDAFNALWENRTSPSAEARPDAGGRDAGRREAGKTNAASPPAEPEARPGGAEAGPARDRGGAPPGSAPRSDGLGPIEARLAERSAAIGDRRPGRTT